ncbi:MAG: hypothetical protein L6R40_001224 [Gallowayella cf. fulva]|nr:MAG: hypothetical protein L6R40_001224 [Xanthomendoza cf. fulva]
MIDGSVLPNPSIGASKEGPRGVKRSRSPEQNENLPLSGGADDDDSKPRKRGRPPKSGQAGGRPASPSLPFNPVTQTIAGQIQTPQLQTQTLPPQTSVPPHRSSPPKPTPAKQSVVKALPTVRDHTTDQLSPEGDEYLPRERDEGGEQKVSPQGHPLGGREYKIRTFFVPGRGDKLFMLATECARVLGYRDSYLLFNKNRSLFKIIATQPEKDDLIHQEILPYSYRSRQIAIVTAKSMFRQFGSRVVQNGRRVRDDYWEAKARKQGFTEEDLAGEKRPGAAKARDAAAAETVNVGAAALGQHQDIIYSNGPLENHPHGLHPVLPGHMPASIAPLPMIHLAPSPDDLRLRDYGNIPRPRQEITGAPYQDRTQQSNSSEILNQAAHTADMNKAINQQRIIRSRGLEEQWTRKRETPVSTPKQQQSGEPGPADQQSLQSPPMSSSSMTNPGQPAAYPNQPSQMMSPTYSQPTHHSNNPLAQSPARQQPIRSDSIHQRPAGLSYGPSAPQQGSQYTGYGQTSHLWGQPPPQPHQSPISSNPGLPQYSPSQQHHPSHPSPSPHQPPQLHPSQGSSSMHGAGMGGGYTSMGGVGPTGYASMGSQRSMYHQPGQSPHQYMQQTTAAQQAGMQGWAAPPPPTPPQPGQHPGQQGWPGF